MSVKIHASFFKEVIGQEYDYQQAVDEYFSKYSACSAMPDPDYRVIPNSGKSIHIIDYVNERELDTFLIEWKVSPWEQLGFYVIGDPNQEGCFYIEHTQYCKLKKDLGVTDEEICEAITKITCDKINKLYVWGFHDLYGRMNNWVI